ncbi:MAG: hypothetical protein ACFWTX_10905 [Acidaminococcus timonensis]
MVIPAPLSILYSQLCLCIIRTLGCQFGKDIFQQGCRFFFQVFIGLRSILLPQCRHLGYLMYRTILEVFQKRGFCFYIIDCFIDFQDFILASLIADPQFLCIQRMGDTGRRLRPVFKKPESKNQFFIIFALSLQHAKLREKLVKFLQGYQLFLFIRPFLPLCDRFVPGPYPSGIRFKRNSRFPQLLKRDLFRFFTIICPGACYPAL